MLEVNTNHLSIFEDSNCPQFPYNQNPIFINLNNFVNNLKIFVKLGQIVSHLKIHPEISYPLIVEVGNLLAY